MMATTVEALEIAIQLVIWLDSATALSRIEMSALAAQVAAAD